MKAASPNPVNGASSMFIVLGLTRMPSTSCYAVNQAGLTWRVARMRAKFPGEAMAAYVLVNVEITNSAGFAEYRKLVPATIAAFGGRFLTRGGATEVLEGEWIPKRLVILEFPDVATIKAWYHSPEYQQLLELRKRTATSDFVIIDGV